MAGREGHFVSLIPKQMNNLFKIEIRVFLFFSTVDYMPFISSGGIVHVLFSVIFSGFKIPVVSSFM